MTILETTSAKNELSPIPGAIAKGLFAANAITNIPIAEAMQVARNTAFQSGVPPAKFVSKLGLSAIMYAIVINVVTPATISVLTVVPCSESLNIFSIKKLLFCFLESPSILAPQKPYVKDNNFVLSFLI